MHRQAATVAATEAAPTNQVAIVKINYHIINTTEPFVTTSTSISTYVYKPKSFSSDICQKRIQFYSTLQGLLKPIILGGFISLVLLLP